MNDPMDGMDTLLEAEDTSPEQATPEEPTPIDPEPLGSLEPQPYRIVPQSPMPSNPASPSVEDNERPQSSQSLTLQEDMEIRGHMVKAEEGDGGVDDRTSQEQNNRDGIRASTDADTGENHDNAQNETQDPDDEPQAADRNPQGQTQRPEFSSTTRLLLPLAGFAISAALGWKFLQSQLARNLFTQAIASSAALEVVGRGLLGIGAAAARGVWAMMKHCGRHPRKYWTCGLLYSLWSWGEDIAHCVLDVMLVLGGAIPTETCYCYARRMQMARAI